MHFVLKNPEIHEEDIKNFIGFVADDIAGIRSELPDIQFAWHFLL
jgi:hypothetical protein